MTAKLFLITLLFSQFSFAQGVYCSIDNPAVPITSYTYRGSVDSSLKHSYTFPESLSTNDQLAGAVLSISKSEIGYKLNFQVKSKEYTFFSNNDGNLLTVFLGYTIDCRTNLNSY